MKKLILSITFLISAIMTLEAKNNDKLNEQSDQIAINQNEETQSFYYQADGSMEAMQAQKRRRRRRRRGGGRGYGGGNPVAPFGIGFQYGGSTGLAGYELSYLVTPQIDINVAGGVGTSGFVYSIGSRYFFMNNYGSPFVGLNYSQASGLGDGAALTVTNNESIATYQMKSHSMVLLTGGYRYQWRRLGFRGSLGYGIRMGDDKETLVFLAGDEEGTKSLANAALLGGFNFCLGVSLQIGKYSKK